MEPAEDGGADEFGYRTGPVTSSSGPAILTSAAPQAMTENLGSFDKDREEERFCTAWLRVNLDCDEAEALRARMEAAGEVNDL